ncbi:uncharacterized protein LOC111117789 [Crassostrea virginica]
MKIPKFSGPAGFLILGFCLCLFSLSFFLIGFVAPFWVKVDAVTSATYIIGLWRNCRTLADSTICGDLQNTNDMFVFIQTAGSFGLFVLLTMSVMLSVQVFVLKKRHRFIIITAVSLSIISGVLIFLTVSLFGIFKIRDLIPSVDVPEYENFHFSFYLAVVSLVLSCAASVLLICDYKFA